MRDIVRISNYHFYPTRSKPFCDSLNSTLRKTDPFRQYCDPGDAWSMRSLVPPSNVTGSCDRRQSRAARQVLLEQVVPLLEHWLQESGQDLPSSPRRRTTTPNEPISLAPTYLWEVLHRTAAPGCPVLRDMYRELEEHSWLVRARAPKLAPRRTYAHWFSCGLCGKVFTSRYYLDHHQHLHHTPGRDTSTTTQEVENSSVECLGTVVCGALGGCDRVSLDLEPYYGRGSGVVVEPDAVAIQRAWASQIQPCQEDQIQTELKPNCHALMNECFVDERLNAQLRQTLCDSLSCHTLLHRQELMHRHLTQSLWWRHPIHPEWPIVVLVLGLLGLYYWINFFLMRERGSHGGAAMNKRGRHRLLQKKKIPTNSVSSLSSLFRSRNKKKSL